MTYSLTEGKLSDHLSDEELVEFFRESGNREIIGELFKRYTHLVLGVCYKYLGNHEDARDTAMGVFESLFSSLNKYEVRNFKSWLFTVTKSHCAQVLRERKKDFITIRWEDNLLGEVMENGGFSHHNADEETEERIRKLHRAVGNLSPGQQQCILLFYFEGKSYQQITETTGLNLNEVKSFIQNGKRNLKNALEQNLY
ncbi:MAG: sigma-70 family RNA polymerase sigma factor [Lentimicrobium sp.]|nr:sigma-70 family RNA polymerase sigma factor [Lentimicrobium sp.]